MKIGKLILSIFLSLIPILGFWIFLSSDSEDVMVSFLLCAIPFLINVGLLYFHFTDCPNTENNLQNARKELQNIEKVNQEHVEFLKKYNNALERLEKGLSDKKYSPYIYTTLAEAYSNRLLVDAYKNNFNQIELFSPAARISAELQTLYLEEMARKIDWGNNVERAKKVTSLRELRRNTKAQLEAANHARYQLEYLLSLYPQLQDILDIEFRDLDALTHKDFSAIEHDSVRDYLSQEEYFKLSVTERNQLALDRYIASHSKTKWQIGRDYELYIGYLCEQKRGRVEYTGSTMKLEDLGRDLIVQANGKIYIIQCKYWSQDKTIREKHIMQLFGTVTEYKINHPEYKSVIGVLVTSTILSDVARKFANELEIAVYEKIPLGEYPRIKCNINTNELGEETRIYHLPMDLSYDVTKIDAPNEFMAFTVKQAENAGFRRSYKWHGEQ